MKQTLRIATRKSRLALWQAEYVKNALERQHTGLNVELVPLTTTGDRVLDQPLAKIGGKGLFIKELEHALNENKADIAVHSMKDVPVDVPHGLIIDTVMGREDPRDAFVCRADRDFVDLQPGAVVGTSSLRRRSQLLRLRPDLEVVDLRGNVPTRLEKLRAGEFDAIILAAAGLKRLGLDGEITSRFTPAEIVPAVGQGVVGIERRADDAAVNELLAPLHDTAAWTCVCAERAFSRTLEGGCDVPLAAYATLNGEALEITGLVASLDGSSVVRDEHGGAARDATIIGRELAERLLQAGADRILRELNNEAR